MKSWSRPVVPELPATGTPPRLWNTASASYVTATPSHTAGLYVCGITPYDATHLGHAATYLAFDTLIRVWHDAGLSVQYVQNATDVDDPLLERATATGIDWRTLAADQIALFRRDMESLSVIPPDSYIAVTEMITEVADAVRRLFDRGLAYAVESVDAAPDLYFDAAAAESTIWRLADESKLSRSEMLVLSAERGGDPDRPGKRDPLDPLLWRSARAGEPAWESVLGAGRPGWHIECSVIAQEFLDIPVTVNGGGSDLAFPHHEFSAGHTAALTGHPLAEVYSHAGMVAYEGTKMSKSLGNLVLVSTLTAQGTDPRAIRLAVLGQHYRSDWEWTNALLVEAESKLARWIAWAGSTEAPSSVDDSGTPTALLTSIRDALADDLDAASAIRAVDAAVQAGPPTTVDLDAIDALLGIRL
jgi:L-cysteine:1D-myo-inositol 2-amino-2-deoxy-alpha-D-glucopyranoside ligase